MIRETIDQKDASFASYACKYSMLCRSFSCDMLEHTFMQE